MDIHNIDYSVVHAALKGEEKNRQNVNVGKPLVSLSVSYTVSKLFS